MSKQQEKPHLPLPPHDDQETQTSYTFQRTRDTKNAM